MILFRPAILRQRAAQATLLALLAVALLAQLLPLQPQQPVGFVGGAVAPKPVEVPQSKLQRRAEAIDVEVVGEEDDDDDDMEEFEEEEMEEDEETDLGPEKPYPDEAYAVYANSELPPSSWYERRKIDRLKVNNVFFDMFAKPKSFFPHKLQPGDTIRLYYLEPVNDGDQRLYRGGYRVDRMRETFFDGVILNFKGDFHFRRMTLRAMVGKGVNIMGMELQFPMHSPLVRRIEVLRRGYIGNNKNAFFMRGLIGKKNVIPLDKERTQMDEMYAMLKEEGREDEIPESEYPQNEWDRYPLPMWKQDKDDWDEEKYAPELVDTRTEYERRVIAKYKWRVPGPKGRGR